MKNNVAGRLHNVLTQWSSFPQDGTALSGWIQVLQLEVPETSGGHLEIYRKVSLLVMDLKELRVQLEGTRISPSTYDAHLRKVEAALAPNLFSLQGGHVKQHLTPEVYVALDFCSELLPAEEVDISKEDFTAIVGLIGDLEQIIADSTLPTSLATLIRRHIEFAERAMADYPVRGARALKDAMKLAVGDMAMEPEFTSGPKTEAGTALRELWLKINSVADGAIKADGVVQLGARVLQLLEKL